MKVRHLVPFGAAALALVVVFFAPSSISAGGGVNQPAWPPVPTAMVNLHGANLPPGTVIPAQGELPFYTVPNDGWFIATGYNSGLSAVHLVETTSTGEVVKLGLFQSLSASGPIGLTFRPGSTVTLRSASADDQPVEKIRLTGYLVRP